MTLDALAHKGRRTSKVDTPETLAIGELDANIFDCPACRRPLDAGSTRCPGCRTRLLAGIRLSTALTFLVAGVLVGALIGGVSVGLVAATSTPAVVSTPSAAPAATAAPVASAPVPATAVPAPGIPAASVSALRQATLLNQRLVVDRGRLAAALAAPEPSSAELARILRSLAGNASVGERIAPVVGEWSRGATVASGFGDFYLAIGATAREGLAAALGNTAAYVAAGRAMQDVLTQLDLLDAQARALAGAAEVELPPLTATSTAP